MSRLRIQLIGLLRSPVSWSRVLREMAGALERTGEVQLAVQPRRGFQWDRDFPLPERLESLPAQWDEPDGLVAFPYPPRLDRVAKRGQPLWALSVYEATRLPPSWIEPLQRVPSQVIVPSRHVREIYRRSGVPRSKLVVIPYGYNPALFDDSARRMYHESGPLRLLTVATPHHRKGLDLICGMSDLFQRYPMDWRIHLPYRVRPGKARFWEDPESILRLEESDFRVTVGARTDQQLASMMIDADLVVQPSRSEGFGLTILEAMAAGTPVVVPAWGGHMDFEGKGMLTVEGELRDADRCQYDERASGARVFEPSQEHLRSRIRDCLDHPDTLVERGKQARQTVKNWTWHETARRMVRVMHERIGV